ncbi:MAG: type II toxin-antitoxin system YafQ family toxin [Synergistaceae bacterium]|nr:type II toxin-antitoxin system YafQ family toxin [Synergistaceae bacterium]MBQ7068262.1 type II toxin-antitoxin system YafQ family toxin [Synergistaceae bacterium]MBR0080562.1 type II toxin-antitoxin system YafQ family toxin [Synergistaceae bacterium]MBR0234231.1 type II toxin-antitoxin system YafQ family toxin [Synergistaceae bacterium]
MRIITDTKAFKRDKKRVEKSNVRYAVKQRFMGVLKALVNDEPLDYSYHDHALTGNWEGYRECHISFDLVLIYKLEDEILQLARLGTHSEVLGL